MINVVNDFFFIFGKFVVKIMVIKVWMMVFFFWMNVVIDNVNFVLGGVKGFF